MLLVTDDIFLKKKIAHATICSDKTFLRNAIQLKAKTVRLTVVHNRLKTKFCNAF